MTAVGTPPQVGGTAAISGNASLDAAPAQLAGGSLLPEPSLGPVDISVLYLLMADQNDTQQKLGKTQIEGKFKAKHDARVAQQEAEKKAHSGGFFKSLVGIVKVVAVAATVAATVMSAGAGSFLLVGVALALSAGGMAVSKTHCLDGILGKGASQWLGMGMQLAGAVVTGAGALAAASSATSAAGQGAAAGASAAGETASTTATAADTTAQTLTNTANAVNGGAKIVEGGATVGQAIEDHQASEHSIFAKRMQQLQGRLQREVEDIITQMQDSKDQYQRNSSIVNQISQTQDETGLIAASGGKA